MTDYELEKSIKQNTIIINNYNNTTVNKDLKTLFQMMDGLDDMKIPKNMSDILLKDYLEYEQYVKTKPESETALIFTTIKIFYKIDNVELIPYQDCLDMYNIILNILNKPQALVRIFKMDGVEYGINPNFDDITLGEMVDCDTEDVVRQISILYRPIIKKKGSEYLIKKYEADISNYPALMNKLTLDVYVGFISFFLKINNDLIKTIQNYLMDQDITQEQKKSLEASGLGMDSYMDYVTMI